MLCTVRYAIAKCLFVTITYCVKTAQPIVEILSSADSPNIPVFCKLILVTKFRHDHLLLTKRQKSLDFAARSAICDFCIF